jgi:hypothetical protein
MIRTSNSASPLPTMSSGNAAPSSSRLSPISEIHDTALPQYGFGSEVSFNDLVDTNPFLFRVYTPRIDLSQSAEDSGKANFIAQRFMDEPPPSLNEARLRKLSSTYADVVQHMDWTTKSSSAYVSTSFSFAWAIWEAVRRYHTNMKHDIEIAVIDATAVADQAVTALSLLRKGTPRESVCIICSCLSASTNSSRIRADDIPIIGNGIDLR